MIRCVVAQIDPDYQAEDSPATTPTPFDPYSPDEPAACVGANSDLFFPERGQSTRQAREICATCPALDPCLEYALGNRIRFGIWGGTSPRQRRGMLKERGDGQLDLSD